jgi:hypothetical protein
MAPKREGPVAAHRREFVNRAISKGVRSIGDLTRDLLLDAYNLFNEESEVALRRSNKGKQKADPDVCDKDGCSHDPKCLNWLGQTEWQEKGSVVHLLCSLWFTLCLLTSCFSHRAGGETLLQGTRPR